MRSRPIFNNLVPSLQLSDLPMYIIKSPPFSTHTLAEISPLPTGIEPGEPLVLGDVQTSLQALSCGRMSVGRLVARSEVTLTKLATINAAKLAENCFRTGNHAK